jgi:hypothetical protein
MTSSSRSDHPAVSGSALLPGRRSQERDLAPRSHDPLPVTPACWVPPSAGVAA